ncbi:hypothetical protein [Ammoniphilus sp. CFH 90114]|nr:hypothetical protein [Ammoniphilus sp. CFH 90114]
MNPNQRDEQLKNNNETKWVIWTFVGFVVLGTLSIGLFMYYYLMRL